MRRCAVRGVQTRHLYPTKSRPEQKIDAAVALGMAICRAMMEDENEAGPDGVLSNPVTFRWALPPLGGCF